MNKVYGGTVRHHDGPSLCLSCRNATALTTPTTTLVNCNQIYSEKSWVPQPILKCSAYDDKSHPSENDFRKTGWIINTDKSGEVIGFLSPKEWKKLTKKDNGDEL